MMSYAAFADELAKIKQAGVARRALELAGRHPGKAMMLAGGGGIMGAGHLKKMKRRHDIGRQVETQQQQAQRAARRAARRRR